MANEALFLRDFRTQVLGHSGLTVLWLGEWYVVLLSLFATEMLSSSQILKLRPNIRRTQVLILWVGKLNNGS